MAVESITDILDVHAIVILSRKLSKLALLRSVWLGTYKSTIAKHCKERWE
jgi:hypothetical protein